MANDGPIKANLGFCPYCGHDNPPQYRFCISCRRRLPDVPRPKLPPAGPTTPPVPSTPATAAGAPAPNPTPPRPVDGPVPIRRGAPWILAPIAIVIVIVIALVATQLLPVYLAGHPATKSPPPVVGKIDDLCTPENGSNCQGFQFALPATVNNYRMNTTACDSFSSLGSGEILWMNYTTDSSIYSIVLPSSAFGGTYGWVENAFEIVVNQTALQSALWFSHLASGTFTESIQIPSGGTSYCIGWWEPSSAPTTVQWLGDVTLTYG